MLHDSERPHKKLSTSCTTAESERARRQKERARRKEEAATLRELPMTSQYAKDADFLTTNGAIRNNLVGDSGARRGRKGRERSETHMSAKTGLLADIDDTEGLEVE